MFFSGHIGDSMDLRKFLTIGMVGSGLFVCMFGMAYFLDIHSIVLFCVIANYGRGVSINRMAVGCVCGWELVWEEQKRFNYGRMERAHISGEYSRLVDCGEMFERDSNWGMSLIIPAFDEALSGLVINLFLVVDPEDAGHASPHDTSLHHEGGDISEDRIELMSAAGGVNRCPPWYLRTMREHRSLD